MNFVVFDGLDDLLVYFIVLFKEAIERLRNLPLLSFKKVIAFTSFVNERNAEVRTIVFELQYMVVKLFDHLFGDIVH